MEIRLKLDHDSDNSHPSEPLSLVVERGRAFITLENPHRAVAVDAQELRTSIAHLLDHDREKGQAIR